MFALIFTAGVALLCGYFFWRFYVSFPGLGRKRWIVGAVLLALASGRFVARGSRWLGLEDVGEMAWMTTAVMLVLLFWFLSLGLLVHLWNGLAWLVGCAVKKVRRWQLRPRPAFILSMILIACATVWGWFEAQWIGVRHVTIEVVELPAGRTHLRVALVSDLHVGSPRSRQRLDEAIRLLVELEPDLLVSTGDMVDARFEKVGHMAELFKQVDPPLGKFAILGNHDFYAGLSDTMAFHKAAGFVVLRQESAVPVPGVRLVGVDDPAARRRGHPGKVDEMPVLKKTPSGDLVILLKHRPVIDPDALPFIDVQLSGHIHGGQVYPFSFFTWAAYGFRPGRHVLTDRATLYVTPGTGTWGPPLRVGNPPEVTLIQLRRKQP